MSLSPPANHVRSGRYAIPFFLTLIAAGLAGNYFKFNILNLHFIFGSIFAMLALQFLGPARGILAAAIISSYTYLAWNHPYAIITMTAEVAVVGWLIQRRKISLLMADTLYWLFIGIPLGFFCFYFISHLPVSNSMFLMTKQTLNGIANALIARLIFTGFALYSKSSLISFREIVSNLLAFFVLCSTLIMLIVSSRIDFTEADRSIRTALIQENHRVTGMLENWVENRKLPVVNLARMAETLSPAQMQTRLEQARTSDINFLRIALIDKEATTIAYSPLVDQMGHSTIGKNFADRPYIPVLKQTLKPMLSEVIVSRFGRTVPITIMLAPVLSHGNYDGAVGAIMNFDRLQTILKLYSEKGQDILYTLLDKNDNVIITNHENQKVMMPFSRSKGTLSHHQGGISQWIPALPPNTSTIELWGRSHYVVESTIGRLAEWRLILEQPVAPFQKMLYDRYIGKLTLVFLILLASLAIAELLSRGVASTNEQLHNITSDLPAKLASGATIEWPDSGIQDSKYLIANFRKMADSLTAQFKEIRQINESLEQQVEARTHELKASEEQLVNAMEMAHLGHWEYDVANDLFTFTDHFYKIFRTTAKQVGGYTISSAEYARRFVHPDDIIVVEEETRKAIEATDPHFSRQLEHRMLYADGTVGHITVRFFIVKDSQGRTVKTYGVNQDITERKRREEALRESEEKYRELIEGTDDLITKVDKDSKFLFVNYRSNEIFGLSPKECIGLSAFDFLYPDDRKRTQKWFEDTAAIQNKSGTIENRQVSRNGEIRHMFWTSNFHYAANGTLLDVNGIGRDITERKRAEEALTASEEKLRQAQKMESIGTLAGGIAHDFNNVLYAIIGYTELTMDDVPEGSLAQKNLKEVFKGAMRAKDMVQQILAFSRKADTQKKPIKVQAVVKEAIKLLRTSIPSTIEIRHNIDEDCSPVMADSTQIHQVVMNLATNAYQAMREKGGVLELTLMGAEISSDDSDLDLDPGTYLKLTVSDTGHGMDTVVIEKMFDPYFSTKGPGEGTGMGLAVVHGIVKDHGGNIEVYSKLGEGTTFSVYLPLVETRPFEPETVSAVPVLTGTERILFVDDEEALVFMTQQTLERLGYQVTSRTSSVEALEAFRAKPDAFDLVITDMTMPNITGVELTSRLKEIRADIPIIICTGFSEVMDKNRAKALGIREYVMKPIVKEEIARTIRKVLDEGKEN